jgi:hypothetical protein
MLVCSLALLPLTIVRAVCHRDRCTKDVQEAPSTGRKICSMISLSSSLHVYGTIAHESTRATSQLLARLELSLELVQSLVIDHPRLMTFLLTTCARVALGRDRVSCLHRLRDGHMPTTRIGLCWRLLELVRRWSPPPSLLCLRHVSRAIGRAALQDGPRPYLCERAMVQRQLTKPAYA